MENADVLLCPHEVDRRKCAVMQTVDTGGVRPRSDFCIAQRQFLLAPN